jgi:uncharacterized repeat protein (TIGR02543 family)
VGAEAGAASTPDGGYFAGNIGNIVIQNTGILMDSTTLYNTITAPAQDLTLYAKWEPIEYTITYNLNG